MSSPSRNACLQHGNVGDLGQQPQLDLRIVRRHQLVAGRRDEGAADLAAVLGANRNVLQVRLVRRQPARGGRGQRVGRVHAMGLRMDIFRQRVGIGRFQFRDLPPFQNLLRKFVALLGEFVEDLRRGRPRAGLGLGAAGHSHLAEDDVADLLGAADIDRLARDLLKLGLDARRGLGEIARQPRQHLAVDRDAAPLHPRQHADQRPFQRLVDRRSCARRRAAASARATAARSRRRFRPNRRSPCRSRPDRRSACSCRCRSARHSRSRRGRTSARPATPARASCARHRAHRTSTARRRCCAA